MIRGEILIELGASWISSKCVEAQQSIMVSSGVKHCFGAGCESGTKLWQTQNTELYYDQLVRQWGISFIVERETAQITV